MLKATTGTPLHSTWPVFENYEVERVNGELYVSAVISPLPSDREDIYAGLEDLWVQRSAKTFYVPLYRHPDLFVRFARLSPKSRSRNEDELLEMVLGWVSDYGILGIEGIDVPAYRGKRRGGRKESVAAFAREVRKAAFVLDAFEAVSSDSLDMMRQCAEKHMPAIEAEPPDELRTTLAGNVAEIVGKHVERDCYPNFRDIFGDFSQGWGFRSLLGAMYLQMMFYALEPKMLRWCKAEDCESIVTFEAGVPPESSRKGARGKYQTRSDKEYCSKACAERMRYRRTKRGHADAN